MIELIEGLPGNVVGIVVSGRISQQDCREVLAPAMQRSLRRHDKIRLYYELSCRFPGAAWEDLDLGIEHAARCERVAIVTDVGWVGLTVRALRFLIPGEIRVFPTIQAPEKSGLDQSPSRIAGGHPCPCPGAGSNALGPIAGSTAIVVAGAGARDGRETPANRRAGPSISQTKPAAGQGHRAACRLARPPALPADPADFAPPTRPIGGCPIGRRRRRRRPINPGGGPPGAPPAPPPIAPAPKNSHYSRVIAGLGGTTCISTWR